MMRVPTVLVPEPELLSACDPRACDHQAPQGETKDAVPPPRIANLMSSDEAVHDFAESGDINAQSIPSFRGSTD